MDGVVRVEQEQTTQERDVVDMVTERDNVEAVEMLEQPGEAAGYVGEERAPVQEPRRSGRVRKTNVSYNPDTWDLARD